MQAESTASRLRTAAGSVAVAALAGGTVLDAVSIAAGAAVPPSSAALASYALIGVGIAMGCVGVLVDVLRRRRGAAGGRRFRFVTALDMAGLGLILGALVLRGHSHIPPDPPLLGAQVIAALACAGALMLRRRTDRE